MGFAERMAADLALVRSGAFRGLCRSRPQDLARRRKMPHDTLVESLLARKGRTLSIEPGDVRANAGVSISGPGYPEALLALAQRHASAACADGDFESLGGMVLVAIAGSSALVPTNEETPGRYGNASGPGAPQATIGVSAAYDPLTNQLLDITLRRGSFDERAEVMGHLAAATSVTGGRPLLAIMDRGYPSLLLMAQPGCAGVGYPMRCSSTFPAAESGRAAAAGGDLWVHVRITRNRLSGLLLRKGPPMAKQFPFQWHITDTCDQRCKHCHIFAEGAPPIVSMPFDKAVRVSDQMGELCARLSLEPYAYLTGGDPIPHPDFWRIMELLHERKVRIAIMDSPLSPHAGRLLPHARPGMRQIPGITRRPAADPRLLPQAGLLRRNARGHPDHP